MERGTASLAPNEGDEIMSDFRIENHDGVGVIFDGGTIIGTLQPGGWPGYLVQGISVQGEFNGKEFVGRRHTGIASGGAADHKGEPTAVEAADAVRR